MPEDNTSNVFHLAPGSAETLTEEPEYAWTKGWVIANTLATAAGAVTGLVALVVAVIALTS